MGDVGSQQCTRHGGRPPVTQALTPPSLTWGANMPHSSLPSSGCAPSCCPSANCFTPFQLHAHASLTHHSLLPRVQHSTVTHHSPRTPHALLGAAAGVRRFRLAHRAPVLGNWPLLLPLLLVLLPSLLLPAPSPAAAAACCCCCPSCAAATAAGSPPAAAAACAAAAAASAAMDALYAALGCHRSSSAATGPKRRPAATTAATQRNSRQLSLC